MGILANLDRHIQNATYKETEGWFADWLRGGVESDSGVHVTDRTAMMMAVIFQCVLWRAKMYGHLPHKVYENVEILGRAAQREARTHNLFTLIHSAPNPSLTSAAWFGLISGDLHLDGNSYAWIERGSQTGRIRNLWRFMPDTMRLDQKNRGAIDYYARRSDGTEQHFSADEILHIRGLGYDGVRGYNPIHLMREELGWTLGTRRFSSKAYKNAFRPSGLLTLPPGVILKPEQKLGLIAALKESGKDGGLALIEGALEYKPLSINQKDMEFISTMEFQDERLAGIMEVHPHELGITRNLNNSITEQMTINSVSRNLLPFSVNVEQWMNLQLLSDAPSSGRGGGTERERFFIQSNFNALLRGDSAAQTSRIREMANIGIYSQNDGRDFLGLEPIEGGDRYFINGAMVPVDKIDEVIEKRGGTPGAEPPGKPGDPGKNAQAFFPIFRDCVGRTINRKDREAAASTIFRPILCGVAQAINATVSDSFMDRYTSALALRTADWEASRSDEIASAEFNRLVEALKERQS